MLFPAVVTEINDISRFGIGWCGAVPNPSHSTTRRQVINRKALQRMGWRRLVKVVEYIGNFLHQAPHTLPHPLHRIASATWHEANRRGTRRREGASTVADYLAYPYFSWQL
jgi:hypothetical protein